MSNLSLNVGGQAYFDCLNLSQTTAPSPNGNFYFIKNPNYTNLFPGAMDIEYGTIIIGSIQIKFGYVYAVPDNIGQNVVNYTTSFPTGAITALSCGYGVTSSVGAISSTGCTFYNDNGGSNVFWIAIGY